MNGSSTRVVMCVLATLVAGMRLPPAVTGQGLRPAQSAAQKPPAPAESLGSLQARALRVHREAIVFDGHMDSVRSMMRPGWKFTDRHEPQKGDEGLRSEQNGQLDLPRMKAGGLTGGFFAISDERMRTAATTEDAMRQLDVLRSLAEQIPDQVMLCLTADDVRRAKADGKVAMMLGLEGGHMINESLGTLRNFARLGVRYMTLTHGEHTTWADATARPPLHHGLTDFGKAVVREMNRIGIIVDVSHASDETFHDALETSLAPVYASHSSARALADHPRNMTDHMIRALAAKGGVIGVNFHAGYLDVPLARARLARQRDIAAFRKELEATYPGEQNAALRAVEFRAFRDSSPMPTIPWTRIVDHIDHMVKLVGVDHVGLGSDFDGAPMPEGLKDSSHLPNITLELLRRGYREADIRKILGGNTLRLLEKVDAVRMRMLAQAIN
jgi:membrane dipeptidase